MMLSVMVVGAGAAFSDQSKIKNTEAVDACTALNIIGGYPDGSFKPEGNITRAEVTKMICVALNGGKNPAVSTNTTPTFSDVRNNANAAWAEGYIESCAAQGIVSGVGGGKFAPNGNVTGVQLAKMLLVSLGYKSENEGFTGNAWATNVNVRAAQKGLYEGLEKMDTNAAITRDNAAQMVWNALNAYEVEYKTTLTTDANGQLTSQITVQDKVVGSTNDKITLLEDKYEAVTDKGILTSVKYNDNDNTYTTQVQGVTYGVKDSQGKDISIGALDSTIDYSALMGQEVKVMYTTDNKSNDITLLGVYATNKNKTVTVLGDDVDVSDKDWNIEVNDKDYELATTTDNGVKKLALNVVAPNGDDASYVKIDQVDVKVAGNIIKKSDVDVVNYYNYTLVDNNNDKVYEYAVVTPFSVEKVDTLTAKKVYFKNAIDEAITSNEDLEDVSYYKDMAEDDYVIKVDDAYTVSGDVEVTKAEQVSGTVSGTKTAGDIQMNGTWYKNPDKTKVDVPNAKDDLKYAIVANGFYFATDGSTGSTDKLALVVNAGKKIFGSDYYDVELLLADGSSKTTKAYVKAANSSAKSGPVAGTLYTYTSSSDGYVLKAIANGKDIGLDETAITDGTYNSKTNKLNNIRVASDAKVFVLYKDHTTDVDKKGKLVTGATADKWTDSNYTVLKAYTDTTVSVMVVDMNNEKNPSATDDALYAVILDAPYASANADDENTVVIPRLLTKDGIKTDVVVDEDDFDADTLTKNMLVSYKMDGDKYVEFAQVSDDDYSYIVGAVTDVNGKYVTVQYKDGETVKAIDVKTDSDSSVLYFDSKDNTEGTGSFKKAMKKTDANYYANVIVVVDLTDAEDDQSYIIKGAAVDIGNQLTDKDENDILIPVTLTPAP